MKSTKGTKMKKIITQFTDEEMVNLGRAMERQGYVSVEKFIADAVIEKAACVTDGKQVS